MTNFTHKIEVVQEEKDLGVTFDKDLKFDKHIKTKVKIPNRLNSGITYQKKKKIIFFTCLYKALVRPHLEYA